MYRWYTQCLLNCRGYLLYIYSFVPDNNILPIARACMRCVVCARMIHGCTTCACVAYARNEQWAIRAFESWAHFERKRKRESNAFRRSKSTSMTNGVLSLPEFATRWL